MLFISKFPNVNLTHLWFMDALLSIYIMFPILKFIYDKDNEYKILKYIIINLIIFSVIPLTFQILVNIIEYKYGTTINLLAPLNNINPFGKYAYSLLYFSIGGILSKLINKKEIKINKLVLIFIFHNFLDLISLLGSNI